MTAPSDKVTFLQVVSWLFAKALGRTNARGLPNFKQGRARGRLVLAVFILCFAIISGRIIQLAAFDQGYDRIRTSSTAKIRIPRPDIVDRSGFVLATDLRSGSMFANPRKVNDIDEAIELLTPHLPNLDVKKLRKKLTSKKGFVWVKREVTPRLQETLHDLGIAGFGFRNETRRIYPMGSLGAHVLGFVDVDSIGLAGIEKYLDDRGRLFAASLADPHKAAAAPVELSVDVRVQHGLTEELKRAVKKFRAKGALGIVMDAKTGEVVAASSLPDFNPNDPKDALKKDRINRFSGGVFEMGSVFKAVTFAMAFDKGTANLGSRYDVRAPLKAGGSKIDDFHPQRRILTVPEVFTYSSNIGTAKMALGVGIVEHQAFLKKFGFFDRLRTEIPEAAAPLRPRRWGTVSTMTASFGHGLSVQPLQLVAAAAALVNGGRLITPTFLKRDAELVASHSRQVLRAETSRKMRYLFRLNVEKGTGRKAKAEGYAVGGKTGTAEKVVRGRYSKKHRFNSFLGAFPMDDPRYVLVISIDEPQPLPETHGYATSGWNAVPTAGKVIARIAPLLGLRPRTEPVTAESVLNARLGG
ncbi:MAG: penicillin-binding protein 2 [Rhizobiales bacterium]|nr:penicillin-binding protein 2 [Hyphomicrobiales bacterium]